MSPTSSENFEMTWSSDTDTMRKLLVFHSGGMSTTFASFGVTFAWDGAIFLGNLMLFNFLRRSSYTKKIYSPKRYMENEKYKRPKQLPETFWFGWIPALLKFDEEEVIKIAGYDAAMYLRLFSFGIRLFLILSVFNLLLVLPVNLTGHRVEILQKIESGEFSKKQLLDLKEEDPTLKQDTKAKIQDFEEAESVTYRIGSFDKLSMTNLSPDSDHLWAHLIAVWFVTIFTLRFLWEYHQKAVDLRIRYLATRENGTEAHTVLVTDIPGLRFGSPSERLMKSFLFNYLPARVKSNIEASIELLSTTATQRMTQVNNISTSLVNSLTAPLQRPSRPSLKKIREKKVLVGRRRNTMCLPIVQEDVKFVDPEDITDMNPVGWVTSQLKDQASLKEIVERQFREIYPDGLVRCANVIYDTSALQKLFVEYETTVENLRDLIDHYSQKLNGGHIDTKRKGKRVVPLVEGKWAVDLYGTLPLNVDLLDFYKSKLHGLKKRILEEQSCVLTRAVPSAFVTFNSRWAQVVAATAFHHHVPLFWRVQAAPDPEELVWENLKYRAWERVGRHILTWMEFSLIVIFFFIPVAFVQGLIQMDRLKEYPIIGSIVTYPLINGFLKGMIPNLALKMFLAFLPSLLKNMSLRQGLISLSEIDFEIVRKYFIFQTITIFFFSFLASSILGQIQELINDPSALREILGVAAPQAATFFISYILFSGLFESGFAFLNIPNLAKLWVLTKFAGTERAASRVWENQTIEYGTEVPSHTLVILLGLVFSVVNPIILPVTLIYFMTMKLIWTYNMIYIYSEEYQSGGKVWEHIFEHVIVGLVIMHAVMMGLFAIKRFPYLFLMVPLPCLTLLFRLIAHRLYDKPLRILSLRAAHDLDVADHECSEMEDGSVQYKYRHPAMMIDWNELEDIFDDAERIGNVLNALNGRLIKTSRMPSK